MAVYKYQLTSGKSRWRVDKRYRGQRLQESGFKFKAKAEAREREWMDERDQDCGIVTSMTVSQLADRWLAHIKTHIKATTYTSYETSVRLRIVKAAACPAISELGLYLEPKALPR